MGYGMDDLDGYGAITRRLEFSKWNKSAFKRRATAERWRGTIEANDKEARVSEVLRTPGGSNHSLTQAARMTIGCRQRR